MRAWIVGIVIVLLAIGAVAYFQAPMLLSSRIERFELISLRSCSAKSEASTQKSHRDLSRSPEVAPHQRLMR